MLHFPLLAAAAAAAGGMSAQCTDAHVVTSSCLSVA